MPKDLYADFYMPPKAQILCESAGPEADYSGVSGGRSPSAKEYLNFVEGIQARPGTISRKPQFH